MDSAMKEPGKQPHNSDGDAFWGGLVGIGITIGLPIFWVWGLIYAAMMDAWFLFGISLILPPIGIICGIGAFLGIW